MTKIVSKSSDKTVLMSRVKFSDGELMPLLMTPFISAFGSLLMTAGFLDVFLLSTEDSFAVAGMVSAASIPASVAVIHAGTVVEKLKDYTGTVIKEKWRLKTLFSLLAPVGHKMKAGEDSVDLLNKDVSAHLIGGYLSAHSNSYHSRSRKSGTSTHEVKTELVFKPYGAYIKQTVVAAPTKIWDDAYSSTLAVHKFSKNDVVSRKSQTFDDAPF